jgi:hypothetical protein
MRARSFLVAALVAVTAGPAAAQRLSKPWSDSPALRLTDSCATNDSDETFFICSDAFRASLMSAVSSQADPDLLWKIWLPKSARTGGSQWAIFRYDPFQDTAEIARSMNNDANVTFLGMQSANLNNGLCFGTGPPPSFTRVTEYYHFQMNHYRLAVGADEGAALAADGWIPTGESFQGMRDGGCYGASKVFRFSRSLAGRRGSQFLTHDPAECGHVRKNDPAWRPEDIPFYARTPQGSECVDFYYSKIPVYRAYNNRAMFNDMNHRYTTSAAAYAQMIAQGWIGEGVAFCVTGLGI